MPIGFLFWMLFVLMIVLGIWWQWPQPNYRTGAAGFILLVLIFLLGWKVFGFILQ